MISSLSSFVSVPPVSLKHLHAQVAVTRLLLLLPTPLLFQLVRWTKNVPANDSNEIENSRSDKQKRVFVGFVNGLSSGGGDGEGGEGNRDGDRRDDFCFVFRFAMVVRTSSIIFQKLVVIAYYGIISVPYKRDGIGVKYSTGA